MMIEKGQKINNFSQRERSILTRIGEEGNSIEFLLNW